MVSAASSLQYNSIGRKTPSWGSFSQDLLKMGAVELTTSLLFRIPPFFASKFSSDRRRVILDSSSFNLSVICPTFRMTTLLDVLPVFPVGVSLTSFALADMSWHVSIHKLLRTSLGFQLGDRNFRFHVLPFWLDIASWVFTRLTKPILRELRLLVVGVLVYLADCLGVHVPGTSV